MPYCSRCGSEVSDDQRFCSNCGAEIHTDVDYSPEMDMDESTTISSQIPDINTHLAKAIIATLICCAPVGVVAIYYAASVNGKLLKGNIEEARIASEKADKWGNWSIGVGIILGLFYFLSIIISGANY